MITKFMAPKNEKQKASREHHRLMAAHNAHSGIMTVNYYFSLSPHSRIKSYTFCVHANAQFTVIFDVQLKNWSSYAEGIRLGPLKMTMCCEVWCFFRSLALCVCVEKWNRIKFTQKYRQFKAKAKVKALSSRFYLNAKPTEFDRNNDNQKATDKIANMEQRKNANHLHTISGYAKKINGNGTKTKT